MLIVYLSAAIIIGLLYLYQRRNVRNAPNLLYFSCISFCDLFFSVFTIDKNRWIFFEIILDKHVPLLFFFWTNGSLLETEFSLMRLESWNSFFYWLINYQWWKQMTQCQHFIANLFQHFLDMVNVHAYAIECLLDNWRKIQKNCCRTSNDFAASLTLYRGGCFIFTRQRRENPIILLSYE